MNTPPVGSRWKLAQSAPPGERFAPDSWADQVGKVVPLTLEGEQVGQVRLVAATVVEHGLGVELTLERVQ